MQPYYPYLFLFLTCFGSSCEDWTLVPEDFIQVEVTAVDSLSIDSMRITGLIRGLQSEQLQDHGFIWTTQGEPPFIFFFDGKISLGVKTKNDEQAFSTILKLAPNTRHTFKAYATVDEEKYFYSENTAHQTGNAEVFTLSIDYQRGFSLEVSGRLSGTEKGFVAIEHGFCWSVTNPLPTLTDDFINLGNRLNNEIFTATIDGLQNNATHHLRAYAILLLNFKKDTVFGQPLTFDGDLNFWAQRTSFEGGNRVHAVGFSIGQKGYVGTGSGKADFWEYDPEGDVWTQRADFEGGSRSHAVGFSIGQKGYIGTGFESGQRQMDFWEYDPLVNTWNRKADFEGGLRTGAVGFSIGQKGYVGTGYDGTQIRQDFWEYDPEENRWSPRAVFEGGPRTDAAGFALGDNGYVGTGNDGIQFRQDLWKYDPLENRWARQADFGGGVREHAVGFAIISRGYIGTGWGGQPHADFWEYDPQKNLWMERANFDGGGRLDAIGFSIGNKGYIGTGCFDCSTFDSSPRSDFWEYDP